MSLPGFRYHPDPIATGSVKVADAMCVCCDQVRGYIYTGPVYSEEEHEEEICPWCIADGSAHQKLKAEFTDAASVGGTGSWPDVPEDVVEEVAYRTPGFTGWQQERWFTCCDDAAVFLGAVGARELSAFGREAAEAIRKELGWTDGSEWRKYLLSLDRTGQPTAYLFRCLHCQKFGGYSDST